MVFNQTIVASAIIIGSSVDATAYLSQHTFLVSLLIFWIIPMISTFLLALVNGAITKPNFWVLFIFPNFLAFILLVLILAGFLPAWTSIT